MFDKPPAFNEPLGSDLDALPADPFAAEAEPSTEAAPAKRPGRFSPQNWPVRWKVFAIALLPLLLAAVFGGFRIYSSFTEARDLRLAADRAELVPAIIDYMSALEEALFTVPSMAASEEVQANFEARRAELLAQTDDDISDEVRQAVTTLTEQGQELVANAGPSPAELPGRVTDFAPLLLSSETAITGSVGVEDAAVRRQADGLARAVGTHGQMMIQRLLVQRGAELPEPYVRSSMIALAGTEPSNVTGVSALLGNNSEEAAELRRQMVLRLSMMADPAVPVVGSQTMLTSLDATDAIARDVIDNVTPAMIATVDGAADAQRNDAIRDAVLVVAAILVALLIVWWVARSLIRPLRTLRDGALKIAHEDLAAGVERVKAGDEREPDPLPIYTTEEVGQLAHAVDELHTQALLLAGDEARLRVMVNDMFETLSRRNKTLVDQQLSLIDRLERNEEDPERLDSLFRLDHLATRMRRNGANLLVLAGAQVGREQGQPVPLNSLINAAASEVEDYQRVETGMVPDCSVIAAAAGDSVHLLAELIDNALQYSPPTSRVRVTAVQTSDSGVLIDINDAGLGMTDADLRIANMRLNAGGEVTPDNTRHMGLFVVGRLARQHGMTVRLLPGATGTGTIAQVYLPPELLDGYAPAPRATEPAPFADFGAFADPEDQPAVAVQAEAIAPEVPEAVEPEVPEAVEPEVPEPVTEPAAAAEPAPDDDFDIRYEPDSEPADGEASVSVLPRRTPGSSAIATPRDHLFTEVGADQPARPAEEWWTSASDSPEPAPVEAPSNTAGFFASRRRARQQPPPEPEALDEALEEVLDDDLDEDAPELIVDDTESEEPVAADEPEADAADDVAPAQEAAAPAADEAGDVPEAVEAPEVEGAREAEDTAGTGSIDLSDMDRLADEMAPVTGPIPVGSVDLIYQNMVSEWLDPAEVQQLAVPQDWKSVWDNGWAAAADAENVPIEKRTGQGLPVRAPGARLIPGGATPPGQADQAQEEAEDSKADAESNDSHPGRDPQAIRASMSNHFGGVRAARSHARNTTQGLDEQ